MSKKDFPPARKESEIKTAILRFLNSQYMTFAFTVPTTGIPNFRKGKFAGFRTNKTSRGCADILGLKNGRFFSLEVKRPSGVLADHQRDFLVSVGINGGYEAIVYSVEDAVEAWREI